MSAYVVMYNCMTYLLNELGEFLIESQIDHGSVLHIS
jgi:hypothetical protein